MAIIGPGFVFYHIPRTAGTSMRAALGEVVRLDAYDEDPDVPTHVADHGLGVPEYAKYYPSCCGVRNPYTREVSLFLRAKHHPRVNMVAKRIATGMGHASWVSARR